MKPYVKTSINHCRRFYQLYDNRFYAICPENLCIYRNLYGQLRITLSIYRRVKPGLTVFAVCFPFSAIVTAVFAIAHFGSIAKIAGHHDSRTSRVKVWYALHHMFHASVIPVFCCSTEVQFLSVLKISILHPYFVTKISRP